MSREALDELEERLARYPADRYPVQHASAAFHLGVVLVGEGRYEEGELALARAAELFGPEALGAERATALNARGAALRLLGRYEEAVAAFVEAAAAYEAAGRRLERGAAEFNLGLAQRELGDPAEALAAFERARPLLGDGPTPAQAAAVARETAATLLSLGRLEEAAEAAREAAALATEAGDAPGHGGAANVLGLALLGLGRATDAADAFREGAAAHPRSVRPDGYAMAKANLALAVERAGDVPRARLAARQALAVRLAPPPVREQAEAVLARLGDEPGDVLHVLDEESAERWPGILRDELARWADVGEREREEEVESWVQGLLARPARIDDLAEAWLGVLLELPPAAMEDLLRGMLRALAARAAEERSRFRSGVDRASARFHAPQLLRLRDTLARLALELGLEDEWR